MAKAAGRADPIHADIEATHRSYHAVLDAILAHKTAVRVHPARSRPR